MRFMTDHHITVCKRFTQQSEKQGEMDPIHMNSQLYFVGNIHFGILVQTEQ